MYHSTTEYYPSDGNQFIGLLLPWLGTRWLGRDVDRDRWVIPLSTGHPRVLNCGGEWVALSSSATSLHLYVVLMIIILKCQGR